METLTPDDARRLAAFRAPHCVSLFMPATRRATALDQDKIRFKNLADEAERRLIDRGMRSSDARDLLHPARELLHDDMFWRHQADGLALFIARGLFETRRSPIRFRELAVASGRLHLKPLLPALAGDGVFRTLLIHKDSARLFEGTRTQFAEIDLNGAPERLAELLRGVIQPTPARHHRVIDRGHGPSSAPATRAAGGGAAVGATIVDEKTRVLEYFQHLDKALHEHLGNDPAPLVLAGAESVVSIFRQASKHARLAPVDAMHVGPPLDERALHEQSWKTIEPLFTQERDRWAKRCRDSLGAGKAAQDPEHIVAASMQGLVETLFVSLDRELWGEIDVESDQPTAHPDRRMEDEDLLNIAACETIAQRGRVFALTDSEMKELDLSPPAAAILRA